MKKILCFGDSNTWGYNPETKDRYPAEIRWTGVLQHMLEKNEVSVIEQGLCGRTTVYEDSYRPNRKGDDTLKALMKKNQDVDYLILMLGTNDCKKNYHNSADEIADGIDACLDLILHYLKPEQVLLVSPIFLGENVWKKEFDPEFDQESVLVSRNLKKEYEKIARRRKVHFLAASEYADPSDADQEHMDTYGHLHLAQAIRNECASTLKLV